MNNNKKVIIIAACAAVVFAVVVAAAVLQKKINKEQLLVTPDPTVKVSQMPTETAPSTSEAVQSVTPAPVSDAEPSATPEASQAAGAALGQTAVPQDDPNATAGVGTYDNPGFVTYAPIQTTAPAFTYNGYTQEDIYNMVCQRYPDCTFAHLQIDTPPFQYLMYQGQSGDSGPQLYGRVEVDPNTGVMTVESIWDGNTESVQLFTP